MAESQLETQQSIVTGEDGSIGFEYIDAPPTKWTFEPKPVRRFVERELEGKTLNLFAGRTKLRHSGQIIRNDMDTSKDTDYHFNAVNVGEYFERGEFNTVILDPPYNVRKAREKYNGEYKGKFTEIKDQLMTLIAPGGKVLTFGYSSTGMSKSRGFTKKKIALINHKGDHNDTICVVEQKDNRQLTEFTNSGVRDETR